MALPTAPTFLEPADRLRQHLDELHELGTELDAIKQRLTVLATQLQHDFERATTRPTGAPLALTTLEAAEQLRCSDEEIRRMVARGVLPSFRLGRLVRVPYSAVQDLVSESARG